MAANEGSVSFVHGFTWKTGIKRLIQMNIAYHSLRHRSWIEFVIYSCARPLINQYSHMPNRCVVLPANGHLSFCLIVESLCFVTVAMGFYVHLNVKSFNSRTQWHRTENNLDEESSKLIIRIKNELWFVSKWNLLLKTWSLSVWWQWVFKSKLSI